MELFFPLFGFLVTGKVSFPLSLSLFLWASDTHTHTHTRRDPRFTGPPNCFCPDQLRQDKDTTQIYIRENHFPFSTTMALGCWVILPWSALSPFFYFVCVHLYVHFYSSPEILHVCWQKQLLFSHIVMEVCHLFKINHKKKESNQKKHITSL